MRDILEMDPRMLIKMPIELVTETSRQPRSKIHDEVIVQFTKVEDRDVVYAYAGNLAKQNGKAGIRLEIPEHLRADFRMLESHGNAVRAAIGQGVRRSIRFDDAERNLILNIRLEEGEPWISVDVMQAREAKKIKNRDVVSKIRNIYGNPDNFQLSSPVTKALGLSRMRPTLTHSQQLMGTPGAIAPSREKDNRNPFGGLSGSQGCSQGGSMEDMESN